MVAGVERVYESVPAPSRSPDHSPEPQPPAKSAFYRSSISSATAGAETLLVTFAAGLDRRASSRTCRACARGPARRPTRQLQALGVPVIELNQRTAYDLPALLRPGPL